MVCLPLSLSPLPPSLVHSTGTLLRSEDKNSLYGDGQQYLLATGGNDNLVKLWRVTASAALDVHFDLYCSLEGHTLNVMCVCFSPKGDLLASG